MSLDTGKYPGNKDVFYPVDFYNIVKIVLQGKVKGEGTIVLGITREVYNL